MQAPPEDLPPTGFRPLLLLALEATKVPRAAIPKACGVLPRTVARWQDGDCEPGVVAKSIVILTLHESGRLPQNLLEGLARDIGFDPWQLGIGAPPPAT